MKKYIIFAALALVSCIKYPPTGSEPARPEAIHFETGLPVRMKDAPAGTLTIQRVTYEGHSYIVFTQHGPGATSIAVLEDPDCPCDADTSGRLTLNLFQDKEPLNKLKPLHPTNVNIPVPMTNLKTIPQCGTK